MPTLANGAAENAEPMALTLVRDVGSSQGRGGEIISTRLAVIADPAARARCVAMLSETIASNGSLTLAQTETAVTISSSLTSPLPLDVAAHPPFTAGSSKGVAHIASRLAAAGVDGAPRILEGDNGLLLALRAPAARADQRMDATDGIARWTATARGGPLPAAVEASTRSMLANIGSVIIAGMHAPSSRQIRSAFASRESSAPRTLIDGASRSAADAGLVYGFAAHLEDFDDTHPASVTHPGACVVPAALAVADEQRSHPDDLLVATALGAEVAIRLGLVLTPALERGWHLSGLVSPIASAVAAAHLLGLDEVATRGAIALAATRSSGLTESLGTLCKPAHLAHGAAMGIAAALHARDATVEPVDAVSALLDAVGASEPLSLDGSWHLIENEPKPYACGVLGHTVLDVAKEMRGAADPDRVEVEVSRLAMRAMGRTQVASALEAKFSLAHVAALGLVRGSADPDDFEQHDDDAVAALRHRTSVAVDERFDRYEARVTVTSRDGSIRRGHAQRPRRMSDSEVRDKGRRLLALHHGALADSILDALQAADVGALDALLSADKPAAALVDGVTHQDKEVRP